MISGFLSVALGGGIGAALRHGVGIAALRITPGQHWPWGTFTVNVLGSLAMGIFIGWLAGRDIKHGSNLRLFFATGLLGGFTTFSAFSLEAFEMLRSGTLAKATLYAGSSLGLGVGALGLGLILARKLMA